MTERVMTAQEAARDILFGSVRLSPVDRGFLHHAYMAFFQFCRQQV